MASNALDITFPGNLAQVRTAAALRLVPTSTIANGDLYLVNDLFGVFAFDASSTLVDDGATVIKPADKTTLQAGRWVYQVSGLAGGPAGPPGPSNNTRVDLAAFKAASIADGTSLFNRKLWTWVSGDFSAIPANRLDVSVVKANSTALNVGAWVAQDGPMYAANMGIKGDASINSGSVVGTDETVLLNSVLAAAKALGIGIVNCGALMIKTSANILCDGAGLVFDAQGYGAGNPGIYPTGSGYTAVTVKGIVPDFRCGVYGTGAVTSDATNTITADTRPNVTGFQFGDAQNLGTLALSKITYARAHNLPRGILIKGVFDTNFDKLSTELCGGAGANDYAIDIQDGGGSGQTTNECSFGNIQSEQSYNKAIRISGNTLACAFNKIHSERAFAKAGVSTWILAGGAYSLNAVRLNATPTGVVSPPRGTAVFAGSGGTITALQAENTDCQYSVNAGGALTFNNATAPFMPASGNVGRVVFNGGVITASNIDGFATFIGTTLAAPSFGYSVSPERAVCIKCEITGFTATSTQAALDLVDCVATGTPASFRSLRILNGSTVSPTTGTTFSIANQYVQVDDTSKIIANVAVDSAGFELLGRIEGNLAITTGTGIQTIGGANANVTGTVTGYAVPGSTTTFIGAHGRGRTSKNLNPAVGNPVGWMYSGSAWVALANL